MYPKTRGSRDSFNINRAACALPAGVVFDPLADAVTITIDKLVTNISAGKFTQRGTRKMYEYRTPRGAEPQIQVRLDSERGTWGFNYSRGDTSGITGYNGITVLLAIGNCHAGQILQATQTTTLRYIVR